MKNKLCDIAIMQITHFSCNFEQENRVEKTEIRGQTKRVTLSHIELLA